jgi:OmpA-OmpF porin, OOP family
MKCFALNIFFFLLCFPAEGTCSFSNEIKIDDSVKITVKRVPLEIGDGMAYAPWLSDDGLQLFFVYRTLSKDNSPAKEHICLSERVSIHDEEWSKPKILRLVDAYENLGSITIDSQGNIYLAYRDQSGEKGDLDIIRIQTSAQSGIIREYVNEINTDRWESQPSVSHDGRSLFFVSNRGNMRSGDKLSKVDIYVSEKDTSGKFTKPVTLGSTINRGQYNASPHIASDYKTLYFATYDSDRKLSIFMSTRNGPEWNDWSKPKRLPNEINVGDATLFMYVPRVGNKVYFTASFSGRLHIYEATIQVPNEYFPTLGK